MFAVGFSLLWYGSSDVQPLPPSPVDSTIVMHPPVLVMPDDRLPPWLVLAVPWCAHAGHPLQ